MRDQAKLFQCCNSLKTQAAQLASRPSRRMRPRFTK
jgi:hypothetical protein